MNSEVEISHKFQPLFELLENDAHPNVDIAILTGGRFSSKSFTVSLFALVGVVENEWRALYSRFTNTSIGDSIKTEVSDKIELLNYESRLKDNQYRIESTEHNGVIAFKGIKTGSKGQTANLKSLSGFNLFIVDEAEEIPDLETFKKVYYSIRSNDKRNICVLILNPTIKEHWIYKEYYEKKQIPDGYCGKNGNIMYIHSSYLDVNPDIIPNNILRDYEQMRIEEPDKYDHVILGGWKEHEDGVLFTKADLQYYDELPTEGIGAKLGFIDIADTGTDWHCCVIGYLVGNDLYIEDVLYTQEDTSINVDLTADIINAHKPEYVRIEVNFGGALYPSMIEGKLNSVTSLLSIREHTGKHTRIITNAGFVKRHVKFKRNVEHGSEYYEFMKNITQYLKDGKSEHDDGIDALTGLCTMTKLFYSNLYE